ncbi:hypothetical protein NPIL_153481 [Nephila pilipes]|uniref:Uncharacterized protein n=1 Tax=Nephila pilipes TaxID=299642 RepID=A0A8X6U211_NEPPI|nr:hypothetical protein NPIL_153481 [Nephila pilipes]
MQLLTYLNWSPVKGDITFYHSQILLRFMLEIHKKGNKEIPADFMCRCKTSKSPQGVELHIEWDFSGEVSGSRVTVLISAELAEETPTSHVAKQQLAEAAAMPVVVLRCLCMLSDVYVLSAA